MPSGRRTVCRVGVVVAASAGPRHRWCRSDGRTPWPTHWWTSEATVARYYDPSTATFLTRDPLEDITGQPYSYSGDDPLDNSDPSGLSSWGDVSDWTAGFGDTITFGGTEQIRRLINYEVNGDMNDVVDRCSTFYSWGGYGALAATAGLGAEDAADLLSSGWERLRSLDWSDDTGAIGKGGGANDAPSWVAREAGLPQPGETAQQYATRILNEKYGPGNWRKGGGSEFSKIVKWATRGGRLS